MDYTLITGALDWTLVLVGLGFIASGIALYKIAIVGARHLLAFISPESYFLDVNGELRAYTYEDDGEATDERYF